MAKLAPEQIAVQLYTLRDYLKNAGEIEESLRRVRTLGYGAVELAGLGSTEAERWKELLERAGLQVCGIHANPKTLLETPENIVKQMEFFDCDYAAYPYPQNETLATREEVLDLAKRLNAVGKMFRRSGKSLLYHNHSIEFQQVGRERILDLLFEHTEPSHMQAELDTYWVQHGGGNPANWCRKLNRRLPILHCKDYVITLQNQPTFAEVGRGNLDWSAILSAALESGTYWFVVEQDVCRGDPFEALTISIDFLQNFPG